MFLDEIIHYKRQEIARQKELTPSAGLARQVAQGPTGMGRDFSQALTRPGIALIAEIKKASPSKGLLCPDLDPGRLAEIYEASGATAISVLTDERFFQGSLQNLREAREKTKKTPLLRKDFILDPYQLLQAKIHGADAVLLIVAALDRSELKRYIQETVALGMTPLVEVHNLPELQTALEVDARVIGINNRDLTTFQVDLNTTFKLMTNLPKGIIAVAESGISGRKELLQLEAAGVGGVLIGESIVTAADPGQKIRELLGIAS